jgi:hypothetical protein
MVLETFQEVKTEEKPLPKYIRSELAVEQGEIGN